MDEAAVKELISRCQLFQGLVAEDVMKIFARGMTMRVAKGEPIFYKGTIGSQMYVVLAGTVGIYDGEKLLASLHMGDMFGEMALVNKEPRSATVLALEDSRLFVLTESTFEKLMTKRVAIQILFNIIRTLSHRLKDSNVRK